MTLGVDIREDSEDFTDEEVVGATPASTMTPLEEFIAGPCPSCGAAVKSVAHAIKRRRPSLYGRVTLSCEEGHQVCRVFRLDYLTEVTL
jgi:hypothetical protein